MEITLKEEQVSESFRRLTELYNEAQEVVRRASTEDAIGTIAISPLDLTIIMDYGAMWERRLNSFYKFMEVLEDNITILKHEMERASNHLTSKPAEDVKQEGEG